MLDKEYIVKQETLNSIFMCFFSVTLYQYDTTLL